MEWCNELLRSTWPTLGKTGAAKASRAPSPEFAAVIDEQIAARREPTAGGPEDLLALMVQTVDPDGWRIAEQHVRTSRSTSSPVRCRPAT